MADAVQVFPPGFRVLDSSGAPLSGAQVRFFVAGTSTPKTVYSDDTLNTSLGSIVYTRSDGYLVSTSGGSTTVMVYVGAGDYKVDILDSNNATIYPAKDNVKGALDTSNFLTTGQTSSLVIPVTAIATDTTLSAGNTGTLIHTTGAITITLPNPATVGNDWNCKIRCNDAANATKVVASAGTIKGQAFSVAAIALTGLGSEIELVCDGANYIVTGRLDGRPNENGRFWAITSRVSSAPATTPPAFYIVSSGFGAFSTGDIIEATGQTTFIGYTPPTNCGWLAWVAGESLLYQFQSSAWVPIHATSTQAKAGTDDVAFMTALQTRNALPLRNYAEYLTNADLSTIIPLDDTIPQITEGTEILTATITPKSTSSRIRVRFNGTCSVASAATAIAALFRDAVSNALQAVAVLPTSTAVAAIFALEFEENPATVSSITYRIRVGASAGNLRMNGTSAARLFGGIARSTLVVEEVITGSS